MFPDDDINPLRLELFDRLVVELIGNRLELLVVAAYQLVIVTSESAPIIASRPLSDLLYFSSVMKSTM